MTLSGVVVLFKATDKVGGSLLIMMKFMETITTGKITHDNIYNKLIDLDRFRKAAMEYYRSKLP